MSRVVPLCESDRATPSRGPSAAAPICKKENNGAILRAPRVNHSVRLRAVHRLCGRVLSPSDELPCRHVHSAASGRVPRVEQPRPPRVPLRLMAGREAPRRQLPPSPQLKPRRPLPGPAAPDAIVAHHAAAGRVGHAGGLRLVEAAVPLVARLLPRRVRQVDTRESEPARSAVVRLDLRGGWLAREGRLRRLGERAAGPLGLVPAAATLGKMLEVDPVRAQRAYPASGAQPHVAASEAGDAPEASDAAARDPVEKGGDGDLALHRSKGGRSLAEGGVRGNREEGDVRPPEAAGGNAEPGRRRLAEGRRLVVPEPVGLIVQQLLLPHHSSFGTPVQ